MAHINQRQQKVIHGFGFYDRTWFSLPVLIMMVTLLADCGANNTEKEDADTITVYLWTTAVYEKYAPYIQSRLPDINIQFVIHWGQAL